MKCADYNFQLCVFCRHGQLCAMWDDRAEINGLHSKKEFIEYIIQGDKITYVSDRFAKVVELHFPQYIGALSAYLLLK